MPTTTKRITRKRKSPVQTPTVEAAPVEPEEVTVPTGLELSQQERTILIDALEERMDALAQWATRPATGGQSTSARSS